MSGANEVPYESAWRDQVVGTKDGHRRHQTTTKSVTKVRKLPPRVRHLLCRRRAVGTREQVVDLW